MSAELPAVMRSLGFDRGYLAVADGQRFRALQRRRMLTASRAGLLVVAGSVAVDVLLLLGVDDAGVWVAVAMDIAILIGALVGWSLLDGRLRHHPEALVFTIMVGVTASTVASGALAPTLAAQALGYLLLLPSVMTMFLPWRTVTHLTWLATYTVLVAVYLALGADGPVGASQPGDLAVVFGVAVSAAVVGHVLLQRTQVQNFIQMERIRSLGRKNEVSHRELERVHRELERTARIDPLTGAGNRRRLLEDLAAIRSGIDRTGVSYGLIEIDLDHFKGINDHLGHLAGDEVLKRVVIAIQDATRADDTVYRYGGEEFVVIGPVPDHDRLRAIAERVRSAVESLAIEHPALRAGAVVTISIGAALLDRACLTWNDEQWFRVVDRALYAAKAGGRNQVCLATVQAA